MTNEIYENYYDSFYKDLQGWRDYELTSKGYEEWYYDCLPDDKQAKILDIGCGDGKFLYFLEQKGYKAIEGLELSRQAASEARKKLKCPIHVVDSSISFLEKYINIYQIITLNDVLEHVPKNETLKFLKAVFNAVIPGGRVIINVPQLSGFTGMFNRYNDFTHETIFTEMSLKQVLFSTGFCKVRFISQKWPYKLNLRHLVYRFVRYIWHCFLKFIYIIESPGEKHPRSFQVRLVATATRPVDRNKVKYE